MRKIALLLSLLFALPVRATVNAPYAPVSYACDGSTAVFTVNFPYQSTSDLVVTTTTPAGIPTTLANVTDWSVNVTSTSSTATLTLLSPATKCPSGNVLKIARNILLTQTTGFRGQTTYKPELHETSADRIVMQIQQVDAKVAATDMKAYVDQAINNTLTGGTTVQPLTWNLTGDGVASAFSIPNAVVNSPDLYIVTIDGVFQKPTSDYSVSTTTAQITFVSVPALNAAISVRSFGYARALNVSDNSMVLATGSSTPRPLKDWFADYTNIRAFGAKCDGTDAAPAIRAAILVAGVGGKVLIPSCLPSESSTTYLLNSYDAASWFGNAIMFWPLDGQTIAAERGTQLKMANGIINATSQPNGGFVFNVDRKNHVTIRGIRIDMNGANNQTPVGGLHLNYTFNQEGGSYNSFIENEVLNGPGRNAFVVNGCIRGSCADQCLLRDNVIHNGGTALPGGNPNQNDYSAIYVECTHSLIETNRTIMDVYPSSTVPNNGGIEIHGSYTVARGNIIDKAFPAFYIGSNIAGQDITDVTVENNIAVNSHGGVYFFPISLTDNYGRIKVRANTFVLTKIPGYSASLPTGVVQQRNSQNIFTTGPGLIYDSEFSDNTVTSTAPTTDSSVGMMFSQLRNVKIVGNQLVSLWQMGIWFEGSPLGLSDVLVEHNEIRDFDASGGGGTNMAIIADAIGESPPTWTALTGGVATAVTQHQWIRPNSNNGFTYDATTAGTTGSGAGPTFTCATPNVTTIADGSVVWTCRNPWKWDGITIRENVFSQTVNQATYRGLYSTNDTTANPAIPVTNLIAWPNFLRNVGVLAGGSPNATQFSNLTVAVPQANSTVTYCSDCTIANPCAGGGTGAIAKRLNGVWVCN